MLTPPFLPGVAADFSETRNRLPQLRKHYGQFSEVSGQCTMESRTRGFSREEALYLGRRGLRLRQVACSFHHTGGASFDQEIGHCLHRFVGDNDRKTVPMLRRSRL